MNADHAVSPLSAREEAGPVGSTARRALPLIFLAGVISAGFAFWIRLRIGGPSGTLYFDDIATALAALAATVTCAWASVRQSGRLRLFWGLMAAASGAWTTAETIWAFYNLVLEKPVPVPSWADLGYLSAIPLAVGALLCHPAMRNGRMKQTRAGIEALMVATSVLYLSWSLVLGPLWHSTDLSTAGGVVAVAYPIGDIVITFLIIQAMRGITAGRRWALSFVLIGLLAMALSDSTYTYLVESNRYATGNPVDTGWVVGYLGLALAGYFGSIETPTRDVVVTERQSSPMPTLVAPYATVLIALLTISAEIELGHRQDAVDWFIALSLVLLVIARQALIVVDRRTAESKRVADNQRSSRLKLTG